MANFVDQGNLQYLTTYKPYVEQNPVEAMVTVGRQRQAQYDQGIQKIQTQVDNIAGLDVVRDVDKQYLQSKMNQLSGNLRKVAAGDFSNYQLVNSVGGMINHIGKDPNIQNAVSSTIRYRKGASEMDAAKKEGKSSPSNEWDFNNQVAKWLNSDDINEGFNGGYNPYTNYKKNALDAIKALTKDESITDDAFTLDSRGNLVIADATVRKKFAGISPDKIQKALMATLSPADFKQMEIDGRYNYSNIDPRQLIQTINNSYSEKIDFYNKQKTVLENAKSSTTSNPERNKLNEQIASLDKTIGSISAEYTSMAKKITSGNADAVKAQLHTSNFIDNFSKAFSYTETSQTYESSPFAQMAMQRANKEQDWNKFLLQMDWDKEKFAFSYEQKEREIKQKDKESGGYGGLPQGIPQEELPKYTLGKVISDTEQTITQVEQADNTFIKQQGKDKEWLEAQKVAWQKNPTAVDPKIADHFNSSEEARRRVEANKVMIDEIRKEAINKYGDIQKFIPNSPDVEYTTPEGNVIAFAPEDFVNYNENFQDYVKFSADPKQPVIFDLDKAKRELSPKEFYLMQLQAGVIPKNPSSTNLARKLYEYDVAVNSPYKQVVKQINDYTADEVNKRITISQGVSYGIPIANEAQRNAMGTVLAQFADLADSQKGKLPNSPNFDSEAARKLAASNDVNYSMTIVEGTQYQDPVYKINVTGKSGDSSISTEFRLTPEQKNAVFGNKFEASPEVQAFRPYQEQIRKMGGYTTALSPGTSNHKNAYLGKIDFPSIQTYGVKANIEQPSSGKYSIRISAYDPITKEWYEDISYPRNQLVREDQVIPLMSKLNDAAVYELLNETSPTAEDLKKVKEASKKPL